ncbi:MAG: hypothetical protein WBV85_02420 [Solirubrobacteraceae bacterium]
MQRQIQLIRALVDEAQYAVDAEAVAEAIVVRALARKAVTGTTFRNDVKAPQVRSFRPTRQARSFRPCSGLGAEEVSAIVLPRRR